MLKQNDDDRRGSLRALVDAGAGVFAPLVLNALMARLAQAAGFRAGYVGGGAMGFLTCATEANLTLTQMVQAATDIRAHSDLLLILDGGCGWGDPMHVRHTVRMAEAAGYCAIEIEDQILPKRAHHHVGVEHLIPQRLMEEKIAAAVAARRSRDFLVIARTNAARVTDLDDALRRAEGCRRQGADLLLVMPRDSGEVRTIAARLPRPLMYMVPTGGLDAIGMPLAELHALGYALVVDPGTPLFAMHRALRHAYGALAGGDIARLDGLSGAAEERLVHASIDLEAMLEIERRTVER